MKRIIKLILLIIILEVLGLFLIQRNVNIQSPLGKTTFITVPTEEITKANIGTIVVQNEKEKEEDKITKKTTPTPIETWGVSRQIDEYTWTIKLGEDKTMATAKEIFEALNEYRKVNGSQVLNWNEKLANYALDRAKYLNTIKTVDGHKGFSNFMENEDGFNKLGFTALGENISYGYRLNGVHIIEWMYAGDKPHDENQLDSRWNYVGIGVDDLATCLIFGTGKF